MATDVETRAEEAFWADPYCRSTHSGHIGVRYTGQTFTRGKLWWTLECIGCGDSCWIRVSPPTYQIVVRDDYGYWRADRVGDANEFSTREEAEEAISELRTLGEDWAAAEYHVEELAGDASV